MRSKPSATLFFILLIAGAVPVTLGARKAQYAFRSTYVLENRGDEPYTLTEDDATLVLFPSDEWQTVSLRNASHPMAREFLDEDGSRMAIIDLGEVIPAGDSLIFSIEYVFESEEKPTLAINPVEATSISDIPPELVEDFCSETETFTRNEDIESMAIRLAENETSVLGILTGMIEWVVTNVEYRNFEVPLYPDETLGDLRGDCDDQAILLISMLRSVGIPAHLQIGVVFNEGIGSDKTSWGGHLKIRQRGVGWHGWAMVYVPPWGWLPIDLTLSGSKDPMEVILDSPQYEDYIVTAFNVSRMPYIGNSIRSRELLMTSDVYVTVKEEAIESSTGQEWLRYLYVGVGAVAGVTFVAVIIYMNRRRQFSTSLVE